MAERSTGAERTPIPCPVKIRVALFIFLFLCTSASGQTYYFSGQGDDANTGLSKASPWRSLSKLEGIPLGAGDSVFLERGSVFFGTLSIQGRGREDNEIYAGAYGTGKNPVITGTAEIKNWQPTAINLWVATCASCKAQPANLFIDGVSQPLGRFPDEGYLTITKSFNNQFSFGDSTLPFPDHVWEGAEVVMKSSRWTIDNIPVIRYVNRTFDLLLPASEKVQGGFGYFIQKHPSTLDRNGEWFFDAETKQLYLYGDNSSAPVEKVTAVSVADVGLSISYSEFVRIENITIKSHALTGVRLMSSDQVTLTSLEISGSGVNGMVVSGCRNTMVQQCTIRDSNNNGVEWENNVDGRFLHNAIIGTGIRPGRGQAGNGTYIALAITGSRSEGNIIRSNWIDSTGYIGIDFRTGKTTIADNVISNFCLVKDDGAGIYTWNNQDGHNTIEGNTIRFGRGCGEGTPEPDQRRASGIYIDDRSKNIAIIGNRVSFCSTAGIFIHNSTAIAIKRNILYANGNHLTNTTKAQLFIQRDAIVPVLNTTLDLDVRDNLFSSPYEGTYGVYFSAEKAEDLYAPGSFAKNTYRSRNAESIIGRFYDADGLCDAPETFDLKAWQAATGLEAGSVFIPDHTADPLTNGKNLIRNSALNHGIHGWITWPDNAAILHEKNSSHDASLKAQPPVGGESLVYHAGFALDAGKTYCLKFSARSATRAKIEFAALAASAPWHSLGRYTCFSADTDFRTFTWYFIPVVGSNNARVNFKSNVTFWLDNVTLREVIAPDDIRSRSAE